jgi:RNA polymerase sigma factor (sigma-70 family)
VQQKLHGTFSRIEARMNVHISYKLRRTPDIDHEIQHWMEKIQKRLQVFRPELVHLKGSVEQKTSREDVSVSLNLRLPSGQMASQQSSATASAALKSAFNDLLGQLGKHKELLRNSHRWRRRTAEDGHRAEGVPFEETIAAIPIPKATSDDVRAYINGNFARLERFIERELFFRESASDLQPGSLAMEEVIDEVAALALDDHALKPDRIALEPWLYRLAISVMDNFAPRSAENDSNLNLQAKRPQHNELASDETRLQFHQPDEALTAESSIRDERASTPEQIAYTDEMVRLVQFALRRADKEEREAFILYALEGFSADEIASITDRKPEHVRQAIARAREKLRRAFPADNAIKRTMAQHTGTN